jgi:hypothetical protein
MSDLHDRIRDLYKGELKRAKAEMNAARDEVARLWQQYEKRCGPIEKKKSGRPSIWKGFEGFFLVGEVEAILARNAREIETGERWDAEVGETDIREMKRITVAQAIRRVVRNFPELKARIGHLDDRTLQARYQMAANHWSEARKKPLERQMEAARGRLNEAIGKVNNLCDSFELDD